VTGCDFVAAMQRKAVAAIVNASRVIVNRSYGGGKHRPLDNAEIERICKRMTNQAMARWSEKRLRLRDDRMKLLAIIL
jgi:hypothetical protein